MFLVIGNVSIVTTVVYYGPLYYAPIATDGAASKT